MITDEQLIGSICRIKCGGQQGTGFFITNTTILTCHHVVIEQSLDIPVLLTFKNSTIKVNLTSHCKDCDLALLELLDDIKQDHYLPLRQSNLVTGLTWRTFGYPANHAGTLVGEPLNGTIAHVIQNSETSIYDLTCNVEHSGLSNPVYKGFSGSPLISDSGSVIGVMKYEGTNHLHSVSIKKAAAFLNAQEIQIFADELDGFTDYEGAAFYGFEQDAKSISKNYANAVAKISTPTGIVSTLLGNVYYPAKPATLTELISEMKRNGPDSSLLWTGWLEFLSHVALLQGDHEDVNEISITIPAAGLSRLVSFMNKGGRNTKLRLRFLWTSEEHYFKVLKDYLHGHQNGGIEKNSCHIFNAKATNFGGGSLKPNFKKNIIGNISSPKGSGPNVMTKINYGLLSLRHINDEIKQCTTVAEATKNLEKLFKDAIEQS